MSMSCSGAFQAEPNVATSDNASLMTSSPRDQQPFLFNASKDNATYGASIVVQPSAFQALIIIKI